LKRVTITVQGRTHCRLQPERRCRLSPNAVSEVLSEMGVTYDRDLNGWTVGNLRLQLVSGIGGGGGYFVKAIRGPDVRSAVAYTKEDVRAICRDYFPRTVERRTRGAFGVRPPATYVILPRRLSGRGEELEREAGFQDRQTKGRTKRSEPTTPHMGDESSNEGTTSS